jgi:ABC-type Fe3+-siderophore transport system permease subunit
MRLLLLFIAALAPILLVWGYFTVLGLGAQTAQSLGVNSTQYLYLVNEWGHGLNWLITITAVLIFIYLAVLVLMIPKRW